MTDMEDAVDGSDGGAPPPKPGPLCPECQTPTQRSGKEKWTCPSCTQEYVAVNRLTCPVCHDALHEPAQVGVNVFYCPTCRETVEPQDILPALYPVGSAIARRRLRKIATGFRDTGGTRR